MRNTVQRHAIILAALLQVLPLVRNFFANPAAANAFAFILKWGVGSAAVVGAYDAHSAASNYFTSPTNFTGNVGVYFTNRLTMLSSGGDGGAIATITSNLVSRVITIGKSTNFAMPPGLTFKLIDDTSLANPVYVAIYGTPTTPITNSFKVTLVYQAFFVETNITIRISGVSSTIPVITNQPVGKTNVAGATTSFSVVAGGNPAPVYQWRLAGSPLAGATNTALSFTNLRTAQAGSYTVVVTNSAGAVTSSPALLAVTNPLPPKVNITILSGSQFQFTFNGIPGLTNTVLTNGNLSSGAWNVFTNIPPPANTNPIIISAQPGKPQLFYRLMVTP